MPVSSVENFAGIRGGFYRDCKDVYFIRAVGGASSLPGDIEKMDRMLTGRMLAGECRYDRISGFPGLFPAEEMLRYTKSYEAWKKNGKKSVDIQATAHNAELGEALGKAYEAVLELFRRKTPTVNDTIERNFAVKLLYWFDQMAAGVTEKWEPKASMKIVFQNVTRKQEYFFCFLLTQVGVDVLLLQYRADIGEELERMNLSRKIVLGGLGEYGINPYDVSKYRSGAKDAQSRTGNSGREEESGVPEEGGNGIESRTVRPVVHLPERGRNAAGSPAARPVVHLPERRRKSSAAVEALVRIPEYGKNGSAVGAASGNGDYAARSSAIPSETTARSVHLPERSRISERQELGFEELARLASSVVMIVIHDQNGKVKGSGSGIMIGKDGYILTNNHVASGGRYYSVRIEEDEQVYTTDEVIKYNSVLDLAVLRIRRRLDPIPVYAGKKGLVRGQRVVAIGSPLGLFNSVSDGIISGFRKVDGVDMIQFTAPISHGSSGGAVLNMYGEVIGISTAGIDSGQNINLAVGYESIQMFIRGFT